MEKDLINEIWLFIATHKPLKNELLGKIKFNKKENVLNYLIDNDFISYEEIGDGLRFFVEDKMETETLIAATVAGLNMSLIAQFVSIDETQRKELMTALLTKNFDKKLQPFEKVKNDNWVLLLNDTNAMIKKYKASEEFELELDVMKRLKKVLETKIKNGDR